MNSTEAKAAAQRTGCTLVDQEITLAQLNQILLTADSPCEMRPGGQLFADFTLGCKLGFVLAIGTASDLRQLHISANEPTLNALVMRCDIKSNKHHIKPCDIITNIISNEMM